MRSPLSLSAAAIAVLIASSHIVFTQQLTYPKELRGYKVEPAAVEMKTDNKGESSPDELIRFGDARLAGVTPLRISLEIPIVVAPVKQKGHVDFLIFEDMVVNGTSVEIDEYHRKFDLPNKDELVLEEPLKFYVNLPNALLAALGEWTDSKEAWRVTGHVYVFGRYKKFLFTFKRAIPVKIDLNIRNPLRK
jgi:hypothetical protein